MKTLPPEPTLSGPFIESWNEIHLWAISNDSTWSATFQQMRGFSDVEILRVLSYRLLIEKVEAMRRLNELAAAMPPLPILISKTTKPRTT